MASGGAEARRRGPRLSRELAIVKRHECGAVVSASNRLSIRPPRGQNERRADVAASAPSSFGTPLPTSADHWQVYEQSELATTPPSGLVVIDVNVNMLALMNVSVIVVV
jgi:hypothetical protein